MSNEEDRVQKQREAGEREAAKLWRAWRTVHEMVQDRGYQLTDDEVKISFEDFKEKFSNGDGNILRNKMNFSARPSDSMMEKYSTPATDKNPNPPAPEIGTIYVDFNADSNVGIKQMRAFAHELQENNHTTGIFITTVPVTSTGAKITESTKNQGIMIECFLESDLLVNITHHELVPTHVLLSKEERARLLERYRLKATQLPRIQVNDPVAKYLGLRQGQVVKIIRKSETAGRYASYRLCV